MTKGRATKRAKDVPISPVTAYEELLAELAWLAARDRDDPFPYEGCRRLRGLTDGRSASLAPDLACYLAEIAGYRSWGRKILKWPGDRIDHVDGRLQQSFFDRHPEHLELKPLIDDAWVPDVREALETADRTRTRLRELFSRIRADRRETSGQESR